MEKRYHTVRSKGLLWILALTLVMSCFSFCNPTVTHAATKEGSKMVLWDAPGTNSDNCIGIRTLPGTYKKVKSKPDWVTVKSVSSNKKIKVTAKKYSGTKRTGTISIKCDGFTYTFEVREIGTKKLVVKARTFFEYSGDPNQDKIAKTKKLPSDYNSTQSRPSWIGVSRVHRDRHPELIELMAARKKAGVYKGNVLVQHMKGYVLYPVTYTVY